MEMSLDQIVVSTGSVPPLKILFMDDNQPTCMKDLVLMVHLGMQLGFVVLGCACTTALSLM